MNIVKSISKYNSKSPVVVTIGTFDGVHIGHKKIIERLTNTANQHGFVSTVLTFFPHPRMVLQKDADIKLLNTIEEKGVILHKLGLEQLIVHPFTKEFSRLSATEFVRDLLVNKLNAKKVVIGYDHRFGRNRNANIDDLITFGETFNFSVEQISAQEINEVSVSSTKIRTALEAGDIVTANNYLGYRYMLTGTVKRGKGLGRQLNFPTANLFIEEEYKLIPKNGVYVVQSTINGQVISGMMNIGVNPTVNGKKKSIEVHFFDFNQDLYEQKLQIDIIRRIRDEIKFDSLDALKEQLAKDQLVSKQIIAS